MADHAAKAKKINPSEYIAELVERFSEDGMIRLLEDSSRFMAIRNQYLTGGEAGIVKFLEMLASLEANDEMPVFTKQLVPVFRELFVFRIAESITRDLPCDEVKNAVQVLRKLFTGHYSERLIQGAMKKEFVN